MKRFLAFAGFLILGAVLASGGMNLRERYTSPPPSVKADTCLLQECLDGSVSYPIAQLDDSERVTLIELGLEQLRLENLVGSMVERFGHTMQPFAAGWRVEQRQTIELNSLFDKYGVAQAKMPDSDLGGSLATTTRAGCVQVLDQLRHLQERLTNEQAVFGNRPDIRRFMQDTTKASQDSLAPAFERCSKES